MRVRVNAGLPQRITHRIPSLAVREGGSAAPMTREECRTVPGARPRRQPKVVRWASRGAHISERDAYMRNTAAYRCGGFGHTVARVVANVRDIRRVRHYRQNLADRMD